MLDTLKIQSSSISETLARHIERSIVRRSGVDMATGQVLYELYSGQVCDERDHGINVRVMRTKLVPVVELVKDPSPVEGVYHAGQENLREVKRTKMVSCSPYLWMEGSVHKAMLGHNVWGGPRELLPSVSWLVSDVARRLDLELPDFTNWDVMRADWAETYDLGSFENCQDYVRSLNSCRFPRREAQRYGDNSLSFPGRSTALRIYHKAPEFLSHDARRLSTRLSTEALSELVTRAENTLRVEVSVKRPKLTEYHSETKATIIPTQFLQQIHDHEVKKVIREANSDLTIVRDAQSVLKRLNAVYPDRDRLVRSLFSTWVQLSGLGENTVKVNMKEWSFYDHRRKLLDAGCAWRGSDVRMGEEVREIMSFVPVPTDPRCTSEEHPEVTKLLEEHRHIA